MLRVNENEEETEQSTAMRDAKEELRMSSSLIYGVATTICTPIVGLTLFFNAAINQEIWQPFQSNYKNIQLGLALHYIASCLPSINSTAAFFVLVITDDTLKREIKKLAMTVVPHHESTQNRDNENPRQVTKTTSFKNPLSISWKGCEGIVEHPLAPQLNNRGPSYQVSSKESRNFGAECSNISTPSLCHCWFFGARLAKRARWVIKCCFTVSVGRGENSRQNIGSDARRCCSSACT